MNRKKSVRLFVVLPAHRRREDEVAARFQHPIGFRDQPAMIRDMLDDLGAEDRIAALVGERNVGRRADQVDNAAVRLGDVATEVIRHPALEERHVGLVAAADVQQVARGVGLGRPLEIREERSIMQVIGIVEVGVYTIQSFQCGTHVDAVPTCLGRGGWQRSRCVSAAAAAPPQRRQRLYSFMAEPQVGQSYQASAEQPATGPPECRWRWTAASLLRPGDADLVGCCTSSQPTARLVRDAPRFSTTGLHRRWRHGHRASSVRRTRE